MRTQDEVRRIVGGEGVIARADHPELRGATESLVRSGDLVPVLPGVYTTPERAADRTIRMLALRARDRDAVLVERTAAQLTYWPGLPGEVVTYALSSARRPRRGFRAVRRAVPPDLVQQRGPWSVTVPALTALDLCGELGGDGIDQALRSRAATLAGLHRAMELTSHRRGNKDRRALLLDSRDEPWSAAERLCHRLLRGAGISGWRANHLVVLDGLRYYIDVAFPGLRLAVEIDGRLHETDPNVFENDRWRQNALVLDGWVVLRFTWPMLRDHPDEVLREIRAAIAERRRFSDTREPEGASGPASRS